MVIVCKSCGAAAEVKPSDDPDLATACSCGGEEWRKA